MVISLPPLSTPALLAVRVCLSLCGVTFEQGRGRIEMGYEGSLSHQSSYQEEDAVHLVTAPH